MVVNEEEDSKLNTRTLEIVHFNYIYLHDINKQ